MIPSAAKTPHTPPMKTCPANSPAAVPVNAKQRFAATPRPAPSTIRRSIPVRRATTTASGIRTISTSGWIPITAPLSPAGNASRSSM